MKIANHSVVSIHYTLKNDQGEVLDSSEGSEPMNYLHGAHNIIKGLENALIDKSVGDEIEVVVAPEDGYGLREDDLFDEVPREAFQGVDNIEVGMRFTAETETGPVSVVIAAVEDDTVVVDRNHELAGEELHFSVSIAAIREATQDEIDHGHAH